MFISAPPRKVTQTNSAAWHCVYTHQHFADGTSDGWLAGRGGAWRGEEEEGALF